MKRGGLLAVVVLLAAIGGMRAAPDVVRRIDPRLAAAAQETQYTFDADGRYLNFTAVLTDPETGEPLSQTLDVLDLSIWDAATDGNRLWAEQQQGIVIDRGVLSIQLGVENALPRDIFDGRALWLEIAPNGVVLSPRILLTRSATSVYSETASDVECGTLPVAEGEEPTGEPTDGEAKEEPLTEGDDLGCISDYEIRPDSVGTEEIKDGSITGADVQDESLTGQDIEDGSIRDVDLATDSVGNEELKDDSVGSAEIQDGSVSKDDLGSDAVDSSKVVDNSLTDADLATNSVGNEELKDDSVGSNEIQDGSVTTEDVADESLTGTDIENGTITTDDIADDTVGTSDVEDNSLTADDLGSNSVGSDELASNSVTTTEIADNTIGSSDIGTGAVGSDEIADGTVGTDDIADDAITSDQIANGSVTAGDLHPDLMTLITGQPGSKPGEAITPVVTGTANATDVDVALAVSGYPLIAVVDGSTTVRLVVCNDTACTNNLTRTFSLPASADATTVAVVVGIDGNPILATPAGTISCDDALCGTATVNVAAAPYANYSSTPIVDAHLSPKGRPWIVFPDSAVECEDALCSTGYGFNWGAGASYHQFDVTVSSSTVDPDGALVIAGKSPWSWGTGEPTLVARCPVGGSCSTPADLQLINTGTTAVAIGADGMPVVAVQTSGWTSDPYDDNDPEDQAPGVYVVRCTAVDCSTRAAAQHTTGDSWAIALAATQATDGSAMFTVTDQTATPGAVTVVRCGGDSCTRLSKTSLNPTGHETFDTSVAAAITIGIDDAPFIAMPGATVTDDTVWPETVANAVHAVHCANRYCVPSYRQH